MVRRLLTALLLLALLLPIAFLGGTPYVILVAFFASTAAWEYGLMLRSRTFEPSLIIMVGGVLLILAARAFRPQAASLVLTASVLAAMTWHLVRYEQGREHAAADLAMSIAGIVYLGWIGAYLVDLRLLPNGVWWLLLVLTTVWVADSAAYFVGVRYGRHKMSPRLSPKKSWEGYVAGIIAGTLFSGLLGGLFTRFGGPNLSAVQVMPLGFALSTLTTLGDLGESLFKRYAGVKDSGDFLPGHGGAFDRIDSLIWAGALGYYWIRLLLL